MDKTEKVNTRPSWDAKFIALIGVMTAVICVLGSLSIPIPMSPVPISLANFAIFLAVYALGARMGTISCLIYLLIGLIGLPVFSSFSGGAAKLLGPTGGYLFGYILMALISGIVIDRSKGNRIIQFFGLVLGTAVCYLFGTLWLAWQASMTVQGALAAGVIPFIPADFVKIILILVIGPEIRERLHAAGLV